MATAAQIQQAQQLLEQQDAARQKAVAAAVALAVASTQKFDGWYSTAAITAWAVRLALGIEGIQRNLARQTDVFMARRASLLSGRTVRPVGAVDVSTLRQGVTHPGVYGRVADTYRYQESRVKAGADVQQAMEAAVARVEELAEMDAALAVRGQAQRFMEALPAAGVEDEAAAEAAAQGPAPARPRLLGYRRVVHPEMSDTGHSCGLCIVASTRLYFVEELMPIHFRCNCLPEMVFEGADPGGLINVADLQKMYDQAGANTRNQLKKTRYQVDQHGELGPVLNSYGAPFRTPDVARDDERS